MRNRIVLGTLFVLCCAVASQAQDPAHKRHRHCVTGTVEAIDRAAETFVVHPTTGPNETFSWKGWKDARCWLNQKRVSCTDLVLKVGDVVTVCQNGQLTIKVTRTGPKTGS
jgi:hypothetical protein